MFQRRRCCGMGERFNEEREMLRGTLMFPARADHWTLTLVSAPGSMSGWVSIGLAADGIAYVAVKRLAYSYGP
jgi:hypothetical protein